MEEEIDLRPYVNALLRYWWAIILTGLIIGVGAVLYASLKEASYRATTIVAFLEPTQSVQFDTRFETVPSKTTILRSLPSLSMSDDVMTQLLANLGDTHIETVTQLERHLSAESGSDLNLLYLRANSSDPELSARLVNQWAEVFVATANEIYASRGASQIEFYVQQVEEAGVRLTDTEQALIDFQGGSRLTMVTNELTSLTNLQANYVDYSTSLTRLRDDIRAARAQLGALPGGAPGVAEDYTLLALQSRLIQLQQLAPITLQIAAASVTTAATTDQSQFLDSLEAAIAEIQPAISEQLAVMEPRILALQREREALNNRANRLASDRELAMETYKTLSRKLDEERLTTNDYSVGFRQVSRAAVPEAPVGTNQILLALAGAAFGAILASLIIILYAWWKK